MMANMSENDRRALRFLGIAVGVIAFLVVVGFPMMDAWDRLGTEITEKQKKIAAIQTGVTDAASAVQARRQLEAMATIYTDPRQLSEQTPRMQVQLEQMPGYGALTVSRIEGLPPRQEESYFRSAVSLQFSGTLADLHQFLDQVDKAAPRLKIERLSITTSANETSKIEGSMVVASYAVLVRQKTEETKG